MIRRPPRSTPLPLHDALPIYQASPKTNDTLTVSVTSHDDDGDAVTYSYQWQKDTGSGFANIAGATGSTLNLATAGQENKRLKIRHRLTPNDGFLFRTQITPRHRHCFFFNDPAAPEIYPSSPPRRSSDLPGFAEDQRHPHGLGHEPRRRR